MPTLSSSANKNVAFHPKPALLALADGSLFYGTAIGCEGDTIGEVVFNTAMTGYQEILTDPSYAKQIVTLTYPHIGNVGCNKADHESPRAWLAGLVIRDLSACYSNWRGEMSLQDFLEQQKIVGISNIDTRRLTRLLREKGAQNGCITTHIEDPALAIQKAQNCPSLVGMDLAKEVSCQQNYLWQEGSITLDDTKKSPLNENQPPLHIVAYDYGVKQMILRLLVDQGCKVTVVPAQTSAEAVLKLNPDGIFLSNGPGDPAVCDYAITATQHFLKTNIPIFGICLGFQILALACGARSLKMKFGHHGANHPIIKLEKNNKGDSTASVLISSQNHGFAIDEASLPPELQATHRSLFDNSLQGIKHRSKPAFGFQGHPEASPGPHELQYLFDQFVNDCIQYRRLRVE